MTSLWHPFAEMGTVEGSELTIDRGEGVYLWDADGNRYLDGTAGLWFTNIGYGRPEIAAAVLAQMEKMAAFHTFGEYSNEPAAALARRIADLAPVPGSKVFFGSGGSDAIDTAGKLVRRYFHEIGQPERTVFIFRNWGYHGMHGVGTSVAGLPPNRDNYGPMIDDVVGVAHDSADALRAAIDEVGAHRVAALFSEPVIGAGGVRPVSETYLKEARQMTRDAGALYIADEVITGFGRSGDWFASNRFSLEPDIMTFAKGVTSGYLPLGGIVASPQVAAPFWKEDGPMWRHGYTYSGHATVCAAGLANLDILESEKLPQRALAMETVLTEKLQPLLDLDVVSEIRSGVGMMAAVQFDPELVAADPTFAGRANYAVRDNGVITRAIAGGGLQISPPLVITESELDEMVAGHRAGIKAVM
ncbi:MAG: aspartate aminotransferase family protein [Acidimicrobiia bacterium]|nr:aspartate aminotransferase family protein [Acidimicrobiia bacterium]